MVEILIKSGSSVAVAVIAAVVVSNLHLDHKKICSLISLSAGALFSAAVLAILPETTEYLTFMESLGGMISGFGLFWLLSKYVIHICPACSASHFDEQTTKKFSELVVLLFTVLSFHSLLDGVAISVGGIHAHSNSIFGAVLAHKLPEGLTLATLMFGAGYQKNKVIIYVFLVEMTTVVGALAGYSLSNFNISGEVIAYIQAHIAGGFIFLSLHAMAGEILKNHKKLVTLSFFSGFLLIFVLVKVFH